MIFENTAGSKVILASIESSDMKVKSVDDTSFICTYDVLFVISAEPLVKEGVNAKGEKYYYIETVDVKKSYANPASVAYIDIKNNTAYLLNEPKEVGYNFGGYEFYFAYSDSRCALAGDKVLLEASIRNTSDPSAIYSFNKTNPSVLSQINDPKHDNIDLSSCITSDSYMLYRNRSEKKIFDPNGVKNPKVVSANIIEQYNFHGEVHTLEHDLYSVIQSASGHLFEYDALTNMAYDTSSGHAIYQSGLLFTEFYIDDSLNINLIDHKVVLDEKSSDHYTRWSFLSSHIYHGNTFVLFYATYNDNSVLLVVRIDSEDNITSYKVEMPYATMPTDSSSEIVVDEFEHLYWISSDKEHIVEVEDTGNETGKYSLLKPANINSFVNEKLTVLSDGSFLFNSYTTGANVGTYKWHPEKDSKPTLISEFDLDVKQIISIDSL